jgi:predicted transcriptional regulator
VGNNIARTRAKSVTFERQSFCSPSPDKAAGNFESPACGVATPRDIEVSSDNAGEIYRVPLSDSESSSIITLTGKVVAAFVAHNSLPSADLPALIASVQAAFERIASGMTAPIVEEQAAPVAAVTVRKSITPDYLICLDDGRRFKSLRRHLAQLGMTPAQYRAKWKLPADYPMVAPNYTALRSAMAKSFGLGQIRKIAVAPKSSAADKSKARGRRRVTKA